ncbi:MAG TPA: hypothetical protein VHT91_06885 [Kofleriaceae bacterium]|nr:hypothetical protein [Kofleriaceae bacterium]
MSARNAAVAAGLIAAVYLAAVFSIRRVPDGLLEALGGPRGIEREGGLVVRYLPPEGVDAARLEHSLALRRMTVRRESGRLVLEIPEVKRAEVDIIVATLTRGGLAFHEVIDDLSLLKVPHDTVDHEDFVAPGVRAMFERWHSDDKGQTSSSAYLRADRLAQLAGAFAQLQAAGWSPPPHTVIAVERGVGAAKSGAEHEEWRSYFLGDEVLLDGDAVANAVRSADPNTGRPVVLLEFDRAGGERFADITRRLVGHKLAAVVGGVVRSAPVINGAITGGRALITVGGGNVDRQEREADALAAVLRLGALPPGGVIEDQRWYPPAAVSMPFVLAVLVIALAGGALVGGAVGIAVRIARPVWQPGMRRPGRLPVRRLAVTLLAPVALMALGNMTLPGANEAELYHIMTRVGGGSMIQFSIVALGIRPMLTAFVVVELALLVVPRWRRVRLQPAARIASGRYVAILGLVFAVFQSYVSVRYLSEWARTGSEVFTSDAATELAAFVSLPAGTLLLVIVAGVIRQHGLGNGYGAVIASDWALRAVHRILDGPTPGHALGLVTLAAIGAATVAMLRMRIGGDREAPLRVPASGSLPLATAGMIAAPWVLSAFGLGGVLQVLGWIPDPSHLGWVLVAAVAALVPLWSLAVSRPAIVAPLALRTALAPPGWSGWRGATLVSGVLLVLIAAASTLSMATHSDAALLGEAAGAVVFAAVVLDLVDDLRARRGDLVMVWPLHQAQHAELVRRTLADAGIACHLAASHLRTLLAVFGPYAPIDVLVPAGSADEARGKIAALYQDVAVEAFD